MKTVKIERLRLLEKLKANRTDHEQLYLDALEGYNIRVEQMLKDALKAFKKTKVLNNLWIQAPVNNTKEYDKVIAILEFSVDEIIELEIPDFEKYVLDNWQWKDQVFAGNNAYAALSGKAR